MHRAALIIVNYRTAALAIDAIRSARAAISSPLFVVVVDNSVDPSESALLHPHCDRLLVSERNLGYGAAINRARKECDALSLIAANPDVVFGERSIDRLLQVDAAVAGPALYWDENYEWGLPPSDLHTLPGLADRMLATRSGAWARRRDRRRIRARMQFQRLQETTCVSALSGAVLAMRADAFDRAGGFDERFRLYFEENDLLRRIGGEIAYVPAARCRHIYNQSAAQSDDAARLYAASEAAYLAKWGGARMSRAVKKLERPHARIDVPTVAADAIDAPPGAWIEASPLPDFETAAGRFAERSPVAIPESVWRAYRSGTLYMRAVDPHTGRVLAACARTKMTS